MAQLVMILMKYFYKLNTFSSLNSHLLFKEADINPYIGFFYFC